MLCLSKNGSARIYVGFASLKNTSLNGQAMEGKASVDNIFTNRNSARTHTSYSSMHEYECCGTVRHMTMLVTGNLK